MSIPPQQDRNFGNDHDYPSIPSLPELRRRVESVTTADIAIQEVKDDTARFLAISEEMRTIMHRAIEMALSPECDMLLRRNDELAGQQVGIANKEVLLRQRLQALGLSGPNPEVSTAKHRAAMLRLHAALAEQRAISERVAEQMLNNAANVLEAGLK